MIEGIEISDFRGIHTGKIDSFKKFNLLVGPNNSGKSSILEMLYLTSTASQSTTMELTINNQRVTADCSTTKKDFLGDFSTIRVADRHKLTTEDFRSGFGTLHLPIKQSSNFLFPPCSLHLTGKKDNQHNKKYTGVVRIGISQHRGMQVNNQPTPFYTVLQNLFRRKIEDGKRELKADLLVYSWVTELSFNNVGESMWTLKGKVPDAGHTLFYDVANMMNHFPAEFYQRTLKTIPGWTQKIAKSFGRVINFNKPFNVQFLPTASQEFMQGAIAPEDQTIIPIDSYGDGARNAFKVLTPLLALTHRVDEDNPGIFIWEEPELFQNPQTLGLLLKEIAELVKDKPIQIFIATHSMEVVAYFLQLVEEGLIGKDELTTIRMNLVDGKLSTSEFSYSEVEDWIEMKLDIRTPSGRFDMQNRLDSPLIYSLQQTEEVGEDD